MGGFHHIHLSCYRTPAIGMAKANVQILDDGGVSALPGPPIATSVLGMLCNNPDIVVSWFLVTKWLGTGLMKYYRFQVLRQDHKLLISEHSWICCAIDRTQASIFWLVILWIFWVFPGLFIRPQDEDCNFHGNRIRTLKVFFFPLLNKVNWNRQYTCCVVIWPWE